MDWIPQIAILIFGCFAIWLVGRLEHWKRWGYIFGLCSQPFWMWTSIANEQWGLLFYRFGTHILGVKAFTIIGLNP